MPDNPLKSISALDITDTKARDVQASGHKVSKVSFEPSTGISKLGFYKECSEEEYYPPLLAKLSVAIAMMYRLSLGERYADERLVYTEAGDIKGTVSIAIENFIPMRASRDPVGDGQEENFANPTMELLIDHNIAELLVASWWLGEDDLHPYNLSLLGRIDGDMSLYPLTCHIKGKRWACGKWLDAPYKSTKLQAADLDTLLLKLDRTHWPTHEIPRNLNFNKTYASQEAFTLLEGSSDYKEQVYFALLKQLLSFQPETIKHRLSDLFGDEPLGLDSLADPTSTENPRKEALLRNFDRNLFYDQIGEERLFADFFINYMEQEHKKFYKLVTENAGFKKYLNEHPEAFAKAKQWFVDNNKSSQDHAFDIEQIDTTYEKICRDAHKSEIITSIHGLSRVKRSLQGLIDFVNKQNVINFSLVSPTDGTASSPPILDTSPVTTPAPADEADSNDIFIKVQEAVNALYDKLDGYSGKYFDSSQDTAETEPYTNKQFVTECRAAIDQFEPLLASIQDTPEPYALAKRALRNLRMAVDKIDFELLKRKQVEAQSETDSSFRIEQSVPAQSTAPQRLPIITSISDKQLRVIFADWLKIKSETPGSRAELDPLFEQAKSEYNKQTPLVGFGWAVGFFSRSGTTEIDRILKDTQPDGQPLTVTEVVSLIFTRKESGWKSNSFNTILFEKLFMKMLSEYRGGGTKTQALLLGVKQAIKLKTFVWHTHAKNIGKNILQDSVDAQQVKTLII